MKEVIRLILTPVWKIWFVLCFAVPFLLLFPFFYITIRTGKIGAAFFLKKIWAFLICLFAGIYPKIAWRGGKYTLPKNCVIVSNHTSYLDICLSVFYVKYTALYMAKVELMKAPLFSIFFKGMDIPVNRKSRVDSHKAFVQAGEAIDKGRSMIIYPEGTISSEGVLRPFKNGPFKLAIEKQVPVVPVVNLNNWRLLQNGGFFKSYGRPGISRIIVFPPIPTTGLSEENLVDLRTSVYNMISNELEKYNGTKN
ncbi:MAG: lysophospholipid acyltransferase family protein [Bacteroidia bacterium]